MVHICDEIKLLNHRDQNKSWPDVQYHTVQHKWYKEKMLDLTTCIPKILIHNFREKI